MSYREYKEQFENILSREVLRIDRMSGAGGDRKYFRLFFDMDKTAIGVIADNCREAKAFIDLSHIFKEQNIPVPRIYAYSNDYKFYVEQDLGNTSLLDIILKGKTEPLSEGLINDNINNVLESLVKLQTCPAQLWEDKVAFKPFNLRQALWDLNYFKYEFVKPLSIVFDEDALEDDFNRLSDNLVDLPEELLGFQMRDCQSRNIMMCPNPYFIDYQGGRKGPAIYDAVSLLWQAKAAFNWDFKMNKMEYFASKFSQCRKISTTLILDNIGMFALFRTLQVLGAYGFRGLIQKRAHFIESIPAALNNLNELRIHGILDEYPELKRISEAILSDQRFKEYDNDKRLRVKIFSFSYKKGYPDDFSGNGGGFMFDCRGMHNPGRYDQYKTLTGRDLPVIEFLKNRGEADTFISKVFEVVKPTIDRYLSRGFSSLQIGFGCTGGRHRSVYCADRISELIRTTFKESVVELNHREQDIKEIYNDR